MQAIRQVFFYFSSGLESGGGADYMQGQIICARIRYLTPQARAQEEAYQVAHNNTAQPKEYGVSSS